MQTDLREPKKGGRRPGTSKNICRGSGEARAHSVTGTEEGKERWGLEGQPTQSTFASLKKMAHLSHKVNYYVQLIILYIKILDFSMHQKKWNITAWTMNR